MDSLILVLVIFSVFLISLYCIIDGIHFFDGFIPFIFAFTSGSVLVLSAISIPFSRHATHDKINQVETIRKSIERARNSENIERASIQIKVIEANVWTRSNKYWNKTIFDWWIPDRIEKVDPIR